MIYLVGSGPGDPGLFTVKGVECMGRADAVVYDRLAPEALLSHAPAGAERIYVGKKPKEPTMPQEEINATLVRLGREGKTVVRLKGGDPYVFGRGGEEALALSEAGVPFEVVPGVSSTLAAPAAAGIPVTHRGLATSVTVATGHARADGSEDESHDWGALARMRGTLVFLMAIENLDRIAARLLAHGRPAGDPAALVRWGTTPEQTVLSSTLGEVAAAARAARIQPPAVLVLGPTVPLAQALGQPNEPVVVWPTRARVRGLRATDEEGAEAR